MYLSRLLSMSALSIVLAVPVYASDNVNSHKDAERQDELKDDRALKKAKSVESDDIIQDDDSDQELIVDANHNPHKRSAADGPDLVLAEKEAEPTKKPLVENQPDSRVPELRVLTAAEQQTLIDQANAGDEQAQDEVAERHYLSKIPILKVDNINLASWTRLANKAEQHDSYCFLVMRIQEEGLAQDLCPNLFTDISTRAESGDPSAQNFMGLAYNWGLWVKKDPALAVEWYRKAAEQGHAAAQNNLGLAYWRGIGVEKNAVLAVEWYRKAAEQGRAQAQYMLGWAYRDGIGVEKNAVLAVEWYRKAAEQGRADAQSMLGEAYWCGIGVEKNAVLAVEWYRKAAEQGIANAQGMLGQAYWDGIGVKKDYVQAVEWYRKAAVQGGPVAKSEIKQKIVLQSNVPMSSEKGLSQRALELCDSVYELTSHCQQKMITNDKEKGFAEAAHAIGRLHTCYQPIYAFGDRLSQILQQLTKPRAGFMVSCLKPNDELSEACLKQEKPTSLLISGDTMTFGEDNVRVAVQLQQYLHIMKREFKTAHKGLKELIRELRPPVADIHAAQQAIYSAKVELAENPGDAEATERYNNAVSRYNQEQEDYEAILAINKIEIDILEGFKNQLDDVKQGLKDLLPSTVGSRNKECLDSPEFSYFKG